MEKIGDGFEWIILKSADVAVFLIGVVIKYFNVPGEVILVKLGTSAVNTPEEIATSYIISFFFWLIFARLFGLLLSQFKPRSNKF